MRMRAAVLEQFGQPLAVQEVELEEPRAGEVLVRLEACGVCHTDMYTASGADPSGYAPAVLGHEGAGIVEKVGEGVTLVQEGDRVVTLFSPQCGECVHCLSPKTNLCMAIREEQNKGHQPGTEDDAGRARLDRRGVHRRAEPRRQPAGEHARPVRRGLGADDSQRDLGHHRVLSERRRAHEMADRLAAGPRQPHAAIGQVALVLLLADRHAEIGLRAEAVDALAALRREQRHDAVTQGTTPRWI